MKDKKAYHKIIKVRTSLIINHPFFASLALRLKVKEDVTCETAWTDGRVFAYNPTYVNILSPEKLEGMAVHTVMHPACGHHKRRGNRDHLTWNRACDYAVNAILLDAGITLPDGFLFNEAYCGKSADTVYEILQQLSDNPENAEPDPDQEGENHNALSGEEENKESASQTPSADDGDEKSDGNLNQPVGSGDPGKSGEVRDEVPEAANGTDTGDETNWDDALVQAAVNARGIGKLPAGVERFVKNRITSKLCWQALLARFIERSARSDYSWVSPNRRYIHKNLYLPSLLNHELNEIVVAIDTSGSIAPEELERFSAEISAIMETYPATLHLIYCDAQISKYQVIERCDLPVAIRPVGGGGTDFRPVFQFIAKTGLAPSCLVYLTDLECRSYPKCAPVFPVLWVKTGKNGNRPPFGEVIALGGS